MILATAILATAASLSSTEAVITIVAGTLTILSIICGAFWWLHRILTRVEGKVFYELDHNGGGSMKDMARDSRDRAREASEDAKAARVAAEFATEMARQTRTDLHRHVVQGQRSEAQLLEYLGKVNPDIPVPAPVLKADDFFI